MLVADDHPVVREGIVAMLEVEPDLAVVAEAANGLEAVELALATSPDVVLLDVQMPGLDGIEALRRLRETLPSAKVLMLTTFGHENYLILSSRAGASGFLLKDVSRSELAGAIRRVAAGESLIEVEPEAESESNRISIRELEVLECMAEGLSNREISAALSISENTVKTHVGHLLGKLEAPDRAGAVLRGWRKGLISGVVADSASNHPSG
ncbi:MAG TPA: response regulator transcription factor [Candidatus Dormibacteraeota bacterium]|nr:response regulator transcription factor [Candidatus Dormibacteraeota bacterium]